MNPVEVKEATELRGPGLFIATEANGSISREEVQLSEDQDLRAGTILGQVEATGEYVQVDPDANDGSEVAKAILYRATKTAVGETKFEVVIARHAEVVATELVYPDGADAGEIDAINAQLNDLQIKLV